MSTSSGELQTALSHGREEYRFYRFADGNPPGQIKAFVVEGHDSYERRVPYNALPSKELQSAFVALTGKRTEELGVPPLSL